MKTACALLAGLLLASLLWLLRPDWYLAANDALAWRLSSPTATQARLERTLTALQREADALHSAPGVLWFGDSHLHRFPPAWQPAGVSNYAIGGETARHLATRIGLYPSLKTARALVLLSGRNDLRHGATAPEVAEAMAAVLQQVPAGVPVLLLDIPPAREAPEAVARRQAANHLLRALCAARSACRQGALDMLGDATGQLRPEFAAPDGVHLNAAGYTRLAALIGQP